jgi:hypothetical protein
VTRRAMCAVCGRITFASRVCNDFACLDKFIAAWRAKLAGTRLAPSVVVGRHQSRHFTAFLKAALTECERCHAADVPLEAHRVIPGSVGGEYTYANTVVLCKPCHKQEDQWPLVPKAVWLDVVFPDADEKASAVRMMAATS